MAADVFPVHLGLGGQSLVKILTQLWASLAYETKYIIN